MTQAARRSERHELDSKIEFIGDFDVLEARGVNISEGGICFELAEPLAFQMRFAHKGGTRTERAVLSWMESTESGGVRVGLRFEREEEPVL